ncbi:MAG: response regulator transcription factor [Gammaproteobacteria bacterium]|jgi:DNA-binding NarL/FixJ family response regulator
MPASDPQTKPGILVASNNTPLTDRISSILGESFSLTITSNPTGFAALTSQSNPLLIMLDPSLFSETLQVTITETLQRTPLTRVVILEDDNNEPVDQLVLFKSGVHGFLSHSITSTLMLKAAHAVCDGEIWIPRQLITKLIGELVRDTSAGTHTLSFAGNSSIEHLTPREIQVAEMVHRGGNNKSIARTLDISERTVKAHLSAIFRKLDIENRLHLALFFNELK